MIWGKKLGHGLFAVESPPLPLGCRVSLSVLCLSNAAVPIGFGECAIFPPAAAETPKAILAPNKELGCASISPPVLLLKFFTEKYVQL